MKCLSCQADNPEERRFCHKCGEKLVKICSRCGSENLPRDKFCGECGQAISVPVDPSATKFSIDEQLEKIKRYLPKNLAEKILAQRDKIEGERKQVTVMFCDMVGFTPLVEQLGPEDAYSIMDQVYEILIHKVHDYEGTVNEMTGDGIMALFGAPIALEDAPLRAVRSAYSIHQEIARFSNGIEQEKDRSVSIKMRIGIHTGLVVVGTLGNDLRVEFKVVGETVNLTSRIEGLAQPGTSYVSEDTFKLTEGLFRFEDLGRKAVKGKDEPVNVYRVIAPSSRRTRFDINAERGLTALVGREREIELLLDGLERVKSGRGQALSITAEAGVGKSRVLYEFRKIVSNEDVSFLEGKCLSYSRGVAYHPIIDILKANFEVSGNDSDAVKRKKVGERLKALGVDETTTLPYILEMLTVKDSGIDQILHGADVKKIRVLEALKRVIIKESEIRPLIMAIEDLHWIDKSSEESLKDLLDSISGSRVLLLFTYRPDFVHTWGGRTYHSQVNLNRFSNRESLLMVENLLGTREIAKELEEFILDRTEGVPFFIEEFVKSLKDLRVLEQKGNRYIATRNLEDVSIPSTIQEVIMARVDSLPETVKMVLQTGSVIGREFSYELIKEVAGLPEKELLSQFSILKDSELFYERGIYPESTYIFKHALTQDAVYKSLMKSTRRKHHKNVAQVLEERFPKTAESQPERLGHHYTEAGLFEDAIPYWQKAGEMAIRHSGHREAADHFTKGIELLQTLKSTPEHLKQELTLQIALFAPLAGAKGYGVPEVEIAYDRALELCEQVGDPTQLFLAIYGQWGISLVRSELRKSHRLAEKGLKLARNIQDTALLMEAHRWNDETAFYRGEFALSHEHFKESLALYNPKEHFSHAPVYGQDPGAALLAHGSLILWQLGYPDQAMKRAEEALTHARDWPHPFSHAFALCYGAILYQYYHEVNKTRERVDEVIAISQVQKFPIWLAYATLLRGWALFEQNQKEEGILQIQKGMANTRASWNELWRTHDLAILAEAYQKSGQVEKGLKMLDEALSMADSTDQRHHEAELNRLKGQFLLMQDEDASEKYFNKAIDVARRQSAKSMELRASVSLGRLWQMQGKKDEACKLLSEIYGWFTEGFNTTDLKEARALLDELL